jgi:hypothetical protein
MICEESHAAVNHLVSYWRSLHALQRRLRSLEQPWREPSPTLMTAEEGVVALERRFWDEANNPQFFRETLADDGGTVFEPMGFIDKASAVKMAEESEAWTDVEMKDVRTIQIAPDVLAVIYHGRGNRAASGEPYQGSITSVYARRDGGWKLVLTVHQPWNPDAKEKAA